MRVLILLTFAILAGTACNIFDEGRPVEEWQERVEAHVTPGASIREIQIYLDSEYKEGMRHVPLSALGTAGDYSRLYQEYGLPKETPIYGAYVPGSNRHLNVIFVLSDDLRFERLIILESFTFF